MKSLSLVFLAFTLSFALNAQKTQEFIVERQLNVPADKVWALVGEQFADIAKAHPKLSSSHYVENTPLTGEGCERVCSLDENSEKYTREKIVDYNPEQKSFKAEIIEAEGLPLESDISYMLYKVEDLGKNKSLLRLTMVYRTSPAFLGKFAKRKFKKNIQEYAIAIEHYTLTGEEVNPSNYEKISKIYSE